MCQSLVDLMIVPFFLRLYDVVLFQFHNVAIRQCSHCEGMEVRTAYEIKSVSVLRVLRFFDQGFRKGG